MYARVTLFPGLPPERIKATLEHFKEESLPMLEQATGYRGMWAGVDCPGPPERGRRALSAGPGRPRIVDQQHGLPVESADRLELPDVEGARRDLQLRSVQQPFVALARRAHQVTDDVPHRVSRIAAAFPGRHRRDQPERTNPRCARDAVLMPSEVTP